MYFLSSRCEALDMSTYTTRQGMLEQDVKMIFRFYAIIGVVIYTYFLSSYWSYSLVVII